MVILVRNVFFYPFPIFSNLLKRLLFQTCIFFSQNTDWQSNAILWFEIVFFSDLFPANAILMISWTLFYIYLFHIIPLSQLIQPFYLLDFLQKIWAAFDNKLFPSWSKSWKSLLIESSNSFLWRLTRYIYYYFYLHKFVLL